MEKLEIGDKKGTERERMLASSLLRISRFLQPALTFLNCHFTDYYIKSYWDTLLPQKLRLDLESKSVGQVQKCMRDLTSGHWKDYAQAQIEHDGPNWNFNNVTSLEELIVAVGKLKLSEIGACTSYKDLREMRNKLEPAHPNLFVDLEFDAFMSSKKMHEVLKFSEFIACACNGVHLTEEMEDLSGGTGGKSKEEIISHIVDVGSGKGYLSSFLALYYDLKVLAIDASSVNTEGCDKRSAKLDKTWSQLVRRAKERQQTGTCTNLGRHWRKKLISLGISPEEYHNSMQQQIQSGENNLKSVTEMITTKTDLQTLVDENLGFEDKPNPGDHIKYGIVGLHTCGNLGANILKLFLHNPNAHFICVVPCCYNLVREDENLYPENVFYGSKFGDGVEGSEKSGPWPDGSIGFPLSSVLTNYKDGKPFVVGRNARMLSAYSLPRMIGSDTGLDMPSVLYYRAMLQVILQQHGIISSNRIAGTNDETDFRVGRMTKKCSSFNDYVRFAFQKLGTSLPNSLTDKEIENVQSTFASPEMLNKFHKYYLIRAMFASVVEDLMLLDRTLYLSEQKTVAEANLVQLFDPALSPRSHAIVGVKC